MSSAWLRSAFDWHRVTGVSQSFSSSDRPWLLLLLLWMEVTDRLWLILPVYAALLLDLCAVLNSCWTICVGLTLKRNIFTACRKASFARAVYATAYPSVRPSVRVTDRQTDGQTLCRSVNIFAARCKKRKTSIEQINFAEHVIHCSTDPARKLHLFLGKSIKSCCKESCLWAQIYVKLFVGWGFVQKQPGQLTALTKPSACIWDGMTSWPGTERRVGGQGELQSSRVRRLQCIPVIM